MTVEGRLRNTRQARHARAGAPSARHARASAPPRSRTRATLERERRREAPAKGQVALATRTRGYCRSFWLTFPPLQAAPSFACSVASLSRFPDHQLPGCSHLRERILADYLLGWGAASAQSAGHAQLQTTPSPKPERNRGSPHVIICGCPN